MSARLTSNRRQVLCVFREFSAKPRTTNSGGGRIGLQTERSLERLFIRSHLRENSLFFEYKLFTRTTTTTTVTSTETAGDDEDRSQHWHLLLLVGRSLPLPLGFSRSSSFGTGSVFLVRLPMQLEPFAFSLSPPTPTSCATRVLFVFKLHSQCDGSPSTAAAACLVGIVKTKAICECLWANGSTSPSAARACVSGPAAPQRARISSVAARGLQHVMPSKSSNLSSRICLCFEQFWCEESIRVASNQNYRPYFERHPPPQPLLNNRKF